MTKKQKRTFHLSGLTVLTTILISMIFPASQSAYAATESYDLYIGSTQVTSDNANDIFGENGADGNPTASYDAATKTLTLNGVHIGADSYHEGEDWYWDIVKFSMYSDTGVVTNLVINGENSFTGEYGIYLLLADQDELKITGTGTLTSTVDGTGNLGTAMTVKGGKLIIGEEEHDSTLDNGTWIYTPTSCTGPRLKLTGLAAGAVFSCASVKMQGGTIIAEATKTYDVVNVGIYLPSSGDTFYKAGTIAAKGKYNEDNEADSGAFSYSAHNRFDDQAAKAFGMQCVYPEGLGSSSNPLNSIDGWAVVGMTAEGFKEQTDAVLTELGLNGSGGGSGTDPADPDGPGTGGEEGGDTGNSHHTDTVTEPSVDIDVQGFTKNETVYSVDVEWGAMTFQYERTTWNAETHTTEPGRGWVVYDNVKDEVIGSTQDAINRIAVTNHSNAAVYATLSYTGNDGYTDITGGFTTKADDTDTVFAAAADTSPAYLTLGTADNGGGTEPGQGKETVGTVYFMPTGIVKTGEAVNDISQWTKIGKITVGILTQQP